MSYRPPLSRTWWLKNPAFKAYMLREATVLPLAFFLACLTFGVAALIKGEAAFAGWLTTMQNPLVILINLLALAASLYHAATFFVLFPRVMPLRVAGKQIPSNVIVLGQWLGVAGVFLFSAWLFAGVLV